ncbi:hypothetical protein [Halarsenatibacter silvermanii]|uniref:Uncharacterized protein n=1 Tax=Halarsenatibacter silvermanii TaxID=321763 RepID=A0A1G9LCC9_9FIRM|nr:hypothetical protein [Halarsenatibacter silvermanii]SDL59544.1 hypothetical protein SAMN04488692_10621 [Halarsenatibacter silvermanii]
MRITGFTSILLILILIFAFQLAVSASSYENEEYEVIIEETLKEAEAEEEFDGEEFELNGELELLRDPFAYYGRIEAEDIIEEEEEEAEVFQPAAAVSKPSFTITGVLQREGMMVALVRKGSSVEMIRSGEAIDGYRLVGWQDREAIFEKQGQRFNLSPQ